MQTLSMTYQRSKDLVVRRVADEAILVPVAANTGNLESVFTLSPVGIFIWEQLDGTRDGAEIAAAVCREYEVEPEVARTDVAEFLSRLEEADLIRPAGGSDAG